MRCVRLLSLIPVAAGSPAHWDPIDPAHGNKTLVLLSKDNPKHATELKQVHENWTATAGAGTIVTVHRIQNVTLWNAFQTKKAQLQLQGSLTHSDVTVYHGSRATAPALIHAGSIGFDPSFGVSQPGYCWFAKGAAYSSNGYAHAVASSTLPFGLRDYTAYLTALHSGVPYSCLKQIFQAKLTLITEEAVGQGFFIVPHAARAYPAYLITYQ